MTEQAAEFLQIGVGDDARDIAFFHRRAISQPDTPMLVWLGGYRSDMTGTKAVALDRFAAENGLAYLRFDYSGHGASGGDFKKGTISRWLEEALAVVRTKSPSRIVLVGSSMGGWIALRMIEELRREDDAPSVVGLVLIAPAPDFTSELIEPSLTEAEKTSLLEKSYFEKHSEYSPEPHIFTRALMEDGRRNCVLRGIIATGCPVRILQGMRDPDVPYRHTLKLVEHLPADDVVLTLIRDGDHRLSRPQDIDRMITTVNALLYFSFFV